MRILTTQGSAVLEILNNEGIYYADPSYNKYKHGSKTVKYLSDKIGHHPIFGWQKICIYRNNLNIYPEGNELINYMSDLDNKTGLNEVIMALDVPDEEVLLTDFYNYSDMMFLESEGPDDFKDLPTWESVFLIEDDRDIQAIIPYIKKEWLIHSRTAGDK